MAKYKIIPSSRTIMHSPISIGHKAEKGVEAIEFDLTAWVEMYGSGTLTVIMRRWGDAIPYPIALEIGEDNKATWTLSDIDTAKAGMAYAQLNYIVGDKVVKKSDIYTFRVMDSLTGEGEPPEAYESWLEHLTHLAAEAMAEVLDIEGVVTDKTLTVDGGIADAKAAGDALALKADKSTTYTKTQVDQMIADIEVETDTTLSVSGKPADAAETGRQIGSLKADLDAVQTNIDSLIGDDGNLNTDDTIWESGSLINATGAKQDNVKLIRSDYLPQNANIFSVASGYLYKLFAYSSSGVYQGCFADNGTVSKPSSAGGFYSVTMDITAYRTTNPTHKIKAVLYHNNADMSPSEYTALETYAGTEKGRIATIEDDMNTLTGRVDALGELVGGENLNADGSIWESGSIKNLTGIKQDYNQFISSGYLPQNANFFKVDADNNYFYKLFVYSASGAYQGCFVDETTVEKSKADGGLYKVDFDISAYRAANPTHKIKAELWHKGSVMTADEYTALEAYESLEKGRITSIEDDMNTLTGRVDDIDDTLSAADLSEISNPEIETADDDWAKGSLLAMTGGYNSTSAWALRSVGYLPDTIEGVSVALEGYSYMLLVYQSDGTYVGLYDTNGTVYKPSTNFKYQITRIDLRAYKTANPTHKFKLCIRKNSEETIAKSEHTAISLHRIRLIDEALIKGETSKDYVFIAASNAPEWQKNAADYICTGTGDAALIRQVLNSINYNGTVKLSFGTFYLDTFVDCTDGVKRAIPLPWMPTDGEPMKTLTIEGSCGSTVAVTATRLLVTDEAYAALSGLTNVPEIIGASASGPQAPETQNRMGLFLKHVSIMTLTNDNPLIGVNLERIGRVWIEDVRVYAHDPNETYTPEIAAQGSVGIRMTGGSNVGSPTMFMSIIVSGWYEGFQVGGEHVIMLNCAALCCYYGYTFGNYPFVRGFVHPNTLINCCDERNVNLPLFNQAGRGYNDGVVSHYPQAINIMDYNMERTPANTPGGVLGNKATVINEADFVGTITFHSTQGANPVWQSFFEAGQGYGFRVRDLNAPLSGTKQERGNHVKHNQGTMFFDTTSNKMLWSINGRWIDVNGTVYQD